jgi:molybdenum cofactor cytidylyltransferase
MNIKGIILSAGYSKRAGMFKPALFIDNKPMVVCVIETMRLFCRSIIVVGGYNYDTLCNLVKNIDSVSTVFNQDYEKGMFSSVKCGVSALIDSGNMTDAVFIIPGDYPLVGCGIYSRMIDVFSDCGHLNPIFVPSFNGKKGHPVLIDGNLLGELASFPDNGTLRDFISGNGFMPVEVDDAGVVLDIDTQEDFLRAVEFLNSKAL